MAMASVPKPGDVHGRHFDEQTQRQMEQDDSTAFSIVSAELLAIVTLGFILVAGTVALILFRS